MPTDFSGKTCSQLLAYAKGGVAAAAKAGCPSSTVNYQYVVDMFTVGGGCSSNIVNNAGSLEGIRKALAAADQDCHNEATARGLHPGTGTGTNTGGRTVTPEVKVPTTQIKTGNTLPVKQSGFSPWLLVGGLGLALLLFGKKRKKSNPGRRRRNRWRSATSYTRPVAYVYYDDYRRTWVWSDSRQRPMQSAKTKQQAMKFARDAGFAPQSL